MFFLTRAIPHLISFMLSNLNPRRDTIHTADRTGWGEKNVMYSVVIVILAGFRRLQVLTNEIVVRARDFRLQTCPTATRTAQAGDGGCGEGANEARRRAKVGPRTKRQGARVISQSDRMDPRV